MLILLIIVAWTALAVLTYGLIKHFKPQWLVDEDDKFYMMLALLVAWFIFLPIFAVEFLSCIGEWVGGVLDGLFGGRNGDI